MIRIRSSRATSRSAAILVRVLAFLCAAASVVVVPGALAAAASGHLATTTALVATGVVVGLALATSVAARGLDPLRAA